MLKGIFQAEMKGHETETQSYEEIKISDKDKYIDKYKC